jgi:hypothetical protein
MAQMIPESLPAKASKGEERLFEVLRDRLPSDFIVWYEPEVKAFYPDFIILAPGFGMLILEVKGWYANSVTCADHHFFEIKYKNDDGTEQVKAQKSPLRQGHDYFAKVTDKLGAYSILQQTKGNYRGRLVFPIGVGAVMSNITESQARERGIDGVLEKPQIAYRDEFLEWKNLSPEALIDRLKSMFKVNFSFPALTEDQISTVRGILHPVGIREVLATQRSVPEGVELLPDSSVIVTLDLGQEKLARNLGDGHRLVSGVAGSGKTLILLARAKIIADRSPDQRILILCFNITLAAHLRSLLHADSQNPQYKERIDVMHFNAWAKSIIHRLPNPNNFDSGEEYDRFLGEKVLATLQKHPLDQRWDSVLVDEAHTFDPSWFPCCVEAVKDPQNGDLLIVSDRNQSLYKRPKFTWKSVGIKAQGSRSRRLKQNYRNTQEILSAAWSVVEPISSEATTSEDVTFPVVKPSAALRRGTKPKLHLAQSKAEAVEALIQQVKQFAESGYALGEIAILYRQYTHKNSDLFTEMLVRLNQLGLRTYWVTENESTKHIYNVSQPGIRIITSLSSLGLEFKIILLLWVEQFADCCNSDLEEASMARRQLYVAMTRAQDELHLFGSGSTRILGELQQSQGFEVLQGSPMLQALSIQNS